MIPRPMQAWTKPFLRWAGSKRSLLPHLVEHYTRGEGRYFEPFSGSACFFFASHPLDAVIADRNEELISAYEALRSHPRRVARALHAHGLDRESYYRVRALEPSSLDAIARAARFIYLNRLCFNGLYRTNRRGRFNVPYGTNTGTLPSERHLYRCSVALRAATLRSGDFAETTHDAAAGDFVYLDPPYTRAPERAYGVYGYGSFGPNDMERMIATLHELDERGARFLFSYADVSEIVDQLPGDWRVTRLSTTGQIAARVRDRVPRAEILVTNSSVSSGRA